MKEKMKYKPLKWNVNWNKLSKKENFLIDFPFIGTYDKAIADIEKQLKNRKISDLDEWNKYPLEIKEFAFTLNKRIKEEIWGSNIFLPEDPADIPLSNHITDKWDVLPMYIQIIEKEMQIEMDIEFWEELDKMKYVEVIEQLYKKKTERISSTNG
jgi:hypothetical protein